LGKIFESNQNRFPNCPTSAHENPKSNYFDEMQMCEKIFHVDASREIPFSLE
jgi:hypothetical protein